MTKQAINSNSILKLSIFIVAILIHMYFFDPSLLKFINEFKEIFKLKFNDRFLLNAIIWLLGFWGIVLFLNSSNKTILFSCWALFIITAFVEFAYVNTLKESFSINNAGMISDVFARIQEMHALDLMKFVGITILLIASAITIKPLALPISKTFLIILSVAIIMLFVAYKGENIILPTFYLVPATLVCKYVFYNNTITSK